ncbi:class-III aminotransferase [Capsaspora owczarzaki ATCC 30864]|uniref:Class-III aminotransferase n=1 Tax=Capsaspora owczarzaki (strain ATCC 30864) TaxID=595528 RepID=A0A0D2WTS7_CAPO3|nr:class-III aminotransferase [Capsaspora owczarzaki ATCC 30864]KJE95098.1 class-III aminotransferase [Capsaspora owczarzaki ATCC 30864]|eukprot:XP_004346261.2 class-III aminotransferase [Capsaspora owczarzaki ATCC 30864]
MSSNQSDNDETHRGWTYESLSAARQTLISPAVKLSYKKPLWIVRGERQFLYDHNGVEYLDAYNNVCHLGHCHPAVVQAVSKQMAILNTNTRYLHTAIVEYASRITATCPPELSVCIFVNSGSEANELALRLAYAYTRQKDLIVLDSAYHGNTNAVVEMSPYKTDHPDGPRAPSHVHKVVAPDDYRGLYRRDKYAPAELGPLYAKHVEETVRKIEHEGRKVAAFFCEGILGCAGQIVLPPGYLASCYKAVRQSGGVCVADEVQVGFGRAGTHMWVFQTQDVVPDIVTLGKPIGNGFPIGAVITRPEIARALGRLEYFNTFGGNPVACKAGLAVLDAIAAEGFMENARVVGNHLLSSLRALARKHPVIGDVRGMGLFLGVELVLDRHTLEPATALTSRVIDAIQQNDKILLGTDGPFNNVVKIKPPLCFTVADADKVIAAFDSALKQETQNATILAKL